MGYLRRRFLTILGAAALAVWGNALPLVGPAEGADKDAEKKPHGKGSGDKDKDDRDDKDKDKGDGGKGKGKRGKQETGAINRPPTDKDECKEDGWRRFTNPTFKNQGQCVSYIERHKKK